MWARSSGPPISIDARLPRLRLAFRLAAVAASDLDVRLKAGRPDDRSLPGPVRDACRGTQFTSGAGFVKGALAGHRVEVAYLGVTQPGLRPRPYLADHRTNTAHAEQMPAVWWREPPGS